MTKQQLRQAFDAWIVHLKDRHRAANTVNAYRRYVRQWLETDLSNNPTDYLAALNKAGKSTATVSLVRAALIQFFDYAMPSHKTNNLWRQTEPPHVLRVPKIEPSPFVDWKKLPLTDPARVRNLAIVRLIVETGAKTSEVVNLNIGALNIERCSVLLTPGGQLAARSMPISSDLVRLLQRMILQRGPVKPNDPLFVSVRGPNSDSRIIREVVCRSCRATCGLNPNQLRHCFAAKLVLESPTTPYQAAMGYRSEFGAFLAQQNMERALDDATDKE